MLKAALECYGFRVHTASSPKEAITLYRDHQRDIGMVLLDYLLPGHVRRIGFREPARLEPRRARGLVDRLRRIGGRWDASRQVCGATFKSHSACRNLFREFGTPLTPPVRAFAIACLIRFLACRFRDRKVANLHRLLEFAAIFASRKAIALWNAAAYILCETFLKVVASGRVQRRQTAWHISLQTLASAARSAS